MIKKNLFIVFCFYLFVIQVAICGLLRQDNKFLILAGINFVVLLLISIFSRGDNSQKSTKNTANSLNSENSNYEVKDHTISQPIHHQRQKSTKKIPLIRFFIIGILAGLFLWYWQSGMVLHLRLLISIACAYLIYLLIGKIFGNKTFNTGFSRFMLFLLICSGIYSIISLQKINIGQENNQNDGLEPQNIISEIDVLGTGFSLSGDINTGDILSGQTEQNFSGNTESGVNDNGLDSTGDTLDTENSIIQNQNEDPNKLATFRDVIKFLLSDETLVKTTNVSFKNISKADPDYVYFRTAYDKKMIGSDLNPNQSPSCETFVVMKGLVEGRNVGTYSDVKQAYRKYASSHNALPGCKYGSFIKIGEMK